MLSLDTTHTPEFLGLSKPGGLWEQAGGVEEAGEGLVLGMIDGGFTPESGSFAPLAEPAPVPPGWAGTCQTGDADDLGGGLIGDGVTQGTQEAAIDCDGDVFNNKVIGARYFVAGFGSPDPDEFLSPRDVGGHGSNTSSIAGGNYGVAITVGGAELGKISGMAPRARISTYKVCWQTPDGGSCASADTTAAINQAVADGVDVINYSISGSTSSAVTPQATAFRAAAAAGIFVSVSAGNSGTSGLSTVAHNYPWVTTVAASTQDREFLADAVTGDGDHYTGTSISTGVEETAAVYARNAAAKDADPDDAELCFPGTLDPKIVTGAIVVCLRGTNARVQKSEVVADAGGVGMVLANDPANGDSTNTERHSVPTVHLGYDDGQAVIDYVGRDTIDPDATLSLTAYNEVLGEDVTAPSMAAFSSRGPANEADGDILKPDVTAPGVDILGSLAPYAPSAGEMYGFQSGTSQASPHIAGIGLLIKYLHPDWTPMAIKSAIVTGAYRTNNQGDPIDRLGEDATPFEYGGGHVEPQVASATPLVYESTEEQWVDWLCAVGDLPPDNPDCAGPEPDPSDLNLPSIAVNDVAGVREIVRTVTNVTSAEVTATATYEQPDGFTISASPAQITVPAGGTATYTVRIQMSGAPADSWRFGAVTWQAGGVDVRTPVVVKGTEPPPFSWQQMDTGSSGSFRGLDAVDANTAWVGSDSGEVLLTTDGGATFTNVTPEGAEPDLLFRDIEAQGGGRAMALAVGPGEDSRIYRTNDFGTTWKEVFRNPDPDAFYDCMAMFNRKHGVLMGDPVDGKFQIQVTSDGGRTWVATPADGMPDALDGEFAFAASGTCINTNVRNAWFGTGGSTEARVFRTADYGQTWQVSSTPIRSTESGGIFSIDFRTNRLGVAIGGDFADPDHAVDALARSTDGGVTWQLVDESKAPGGYRSGSAWWSDHRGDQKVQIDDLQKTIFAVGPTGSDVSQNRGKSWQMFDTSAIHSVECVKRSLVCWSSGPGGWVAKLAVG
jgi:photosystem II stability/assembly factor-like uncharacterized protein